MLNAVFLSVLRASVLKKRFNTETLGSQSFTEMFIILFFAD